MRGPAALLFDLDGTLVDSALGIARALSRLSVARGGGEIAVEPVRRLVSRGVGALVAGALGPLAGDSAADVADFRANLREMPNDPVMIFPGVDACLRGFAAGGHAMAIVTNKPRGLAQKLLEDIGLAGYFGAIVGGDSLAVAKPDPAPLRHALELLGSDGPAVMIGDSDVDGRAAMAAGVPFLLYERGYGVAECDGLAVAGRFAEFGQLAALVHGLDHG